MSAFDSFADSRDMSPTGRDVPDPDLHCRRIVMAKRVVGYAPTTSSADCRLIARTGHSHTLPSFCRLTSAIDRAGYRMPASPDVAEHPSRFSGDDRPSSLANYITTRDRRYSPDWCSGTKGATGSITSRPSFSK
jgi:hypothetical protein